MDEKQPFLSEICFEALVCFEQELKVVLHSKALMVMWVEIQQKSSQEKQWTQTAQPDAAPEESFYLGPTEQIKGPRRTRIGQLGTKRDIRDRIRHSNLQTDRPIEANAKNF